MSKIYVIHENEAWVHPLRTAFDKLNLPFEEWFIGNKTLDLNSVPPEGVFYNRMSASAHTRGHRFSPEMTENVLVWLERHKRKVINGRKALQLELRKSEQYMSLQDFGILHPKTIVSNDISSLPNAVDKLNKFPFIIKPNRGGKGAGVQLFQSKESLNKTIENNEIGESIDGIWLVQEYIQPAKGRIVRAEFVGGEFMYAVSIDASNGFQLCPADACNVEDLFCPAENKSSSNKFEILDQYKNPDLNKYSSFLKSNNIGIGALEYAEDKNGQKWIYDVNTNTNYNSLAEEKSETNKEGMIEIAKFLERELNQIPARNFKY